MNQNQDSVEAGKANEISNGQIRIIDNLWESLQLLHQYRMFLR